MTTTSRDIVCPSINLTLHVVGMCMSAEDEQSTSIVECIIVYLAFFERLTKLGGGRELRSRNPSRRMNDSG